MAFDATRRVVLLFGGSHQGRVLGDTWGWDGSRWRQLTAPGPGARANHAMAADPSRGIIVLFGGWAGTADTLLSDTWIWNGTAWRVAQARGPDAREMPAMAFDPVAGAVLLHGGRAQSGRALSDAWHWTGRWEPR
jgi:hypothetical protein